jgi:uncharacterized damage-inducible protein DinB
MQDVREGRYPTDMNGFLHVIADARQSLESVIDGRSEEDLTQLRDHGGWAVKDHLYHIAVWERGISYLLQGKPRHEGMELTEQQFNELDADEMNAIIFEKNKDRSLDDVMQVFHEEHQTMVNYLSSPTISWEDLQKTYSHYAADDPEVDTGDPVLFWVFGNTAGHFDMHQAWIEEILAQSSTR